MPYHFLEEEATADIAFEACAPDLAGVFRDSADATTNVIVENINDIARRDTRLIELSNEQLDLLLVDFLQELIYFKDAEQLLLRIGEIAVTTEGKLWHVHAVAEGEKIDLKRHIPGTDVKAVTLYQLKLEKNNREWCSHVVLDI